MSGQSFAQLLHVVAESCTDARCLQELLCALEQVQTTSNQLHIISRWGQCGDAVGMGVGCYGDRCGDIVGTLWGWVWGQVWDAVGMGVGTGVGRCGDGCGDTEDAVGMVVGTLWGHYGDDCGDGCGDTVGTGVGCCGDGCFCVDNIARCNVSMGWFRFSPSPLTSAVHTSQ